MIKFKYRISLLIIFGILLTGLVYRYSNRSLGDESQYITPKHKASALTGSYENRPGRSVRNSDQISSVLNEFRASGYPIYDDELLPTFNKDLVDGSEDLKAAFELIKNAEKGTPVFELINMWKIKAKLSAEDFEKISELLEDGSVNEIIDLAKKAAEKDYLNFNLDYSKGPALLLPHLGYSRNMFKILSLKSLADSREGRKEEAVELLNSALKLNSMPSDDITMINKLVENTVTKMLNENIEDLRSSGADLQETTKLIESQLLNSHQEQLKTIDGERHFLGSWIFEKMINSPDEFKKEVAQFMGGNLKDVSPSEAKEHYAAYLKSMLNIRELMDEPYYVNSGKMEAALKAAQDTPIISEIMPAYSSVYKKYNENQSLLKKQLLVLKVDQFMKDHGRTPALKELNLPKENLIDNIYGTDLYYVLEDGRAQVAGVIPVE